MNEIEALRWIEAVAKDGLLARIEHVDRTWNAFLVRLYKTPGSLSAEEHVEFSSTGHARMCDAIYELRQRFEPAWNGSARRTA